MQLGVGRIVKGFLEEEGLMAQAKLWQAERTEVESFYFQISGIYLGAQGEPCIFCSFLG